jgi:hypothetical protein
MGSRLFASLLFLVLISLIIFSNYLLASQERIVEITPSIHYAGAEVIEVYTRGDLTVLVVYPSPKVLFSYRNAYVVLDETLMGYELLVSPKLVPIFEQRLSEKRELIIKALSTISISADEVEFEKVYIYMDLSNKPIDQIVKSVYSVLGDTNITLVIYDKRLEEIRDLYNATNVPEILTSIGGKLKDLYIQMNGELGTRGCLASSDLIIVKVTPAGRGWVYLANILLNAASYNECSDIVEHYVRKLVDITREYIPENIPLYIAVYWAPGVKVKVIPLRGTNPPVKSPTTSTRIEQLEQPLKDEQLIQNYSATSRANIASSGNTGNTLVLTIAVLVLASIALIATLRK